ncbi:MAG: bifunctional 4-hydroxy-2-oxoglutarate aldolase/2-dehydro-3-deoxy-phosphogluconate aldolase [Candidatus Latescibacteria bacterium]|nr:bifunctional 4-hydroxy-2-oxoglutarate aldolase/2-dehydro-3-deoxy-phosphogluconate aldolase [Candidatus Latescibacterota bacterium]
MSMLEKVEACGVVAAIRADSSESLIEVAKALEAGGAKFIEVTMSTPNALKVIEALADTMGDRVGVGVGTVLDPETARAAILAGAEYIVSPTLRLSVIEMAKRYSKMVFPGAFTPTEILTAWEAGADMVKVFPAGRLGPEYMKDIHGPLPQIKLMPTGGVSIENCGEFIKKGASAVTAASCIAPKKDIAAGNWDSITRLAAQMIANIHAAR